MSATTTHLWMGPEQLHTSATVGMFKTTLRGEALLSLHHRKLSSDLHLHFRDEQKCGAYAYAQTDSMCPSELGFNWRYEGPDNSWPDAGKGLAVKCITETGIIRIR